MVDIFPKNFEIFKILLICVVGFFIYISIIFTFEGDEPLSDILLLVFTFIISPAYYFITLILLGLVYGFGTVFTAGSEYLKLSNMSGIGYFGITVFGVFTFAITVGILIGIVRVFIILFKAIFRIEDSYY